MFRFLSPKFCVSGVVQANVGQKLVKGNILGVFTMSPKQDPQATFCLNDA